MAESARIELSMPESWGRHVRTIIIAIVIVVALAYGVDLGAFPYFPRM
ncbi:hypothetical protein Ppa06_64780 [Planomonospora parontospora subsp. parontospora]|uniref:Uncharacterized protein n=2 Tax=Planomonospora parontospora TaxID=58119 RepID=A0AA37BN49_9ACTN|nr:hypothetical protein [Planomonospora parontospora]GGK94349.1 hypothetical protein GCM10010126_62240 [Planomonospora parontospora]GII12680.1 hypothetical protein Ppa06_64780 [Planomonospora parontospora subsp. parontospora]